MEQELQNPPRPWQGTTIGVLNIIGLATSAILALVLIVFSAALSAYIQETPLALLAGAGTVILGIVIIPFIILGIFITIGIFKGQKWAVIVSLIFTGLGLLGNLFSFNLIGLIINGFLLYCQIICLNDPFYNQNTAIA